MSRVNSHGNRMKVAIVATGLDLWRSAGEAAVSARKIGHTLGMTHSAVLYHFGSAGVLKATIAAEAVRQGDAAIVPQLIVANHPAAAALSAEQRQAFLSSSLKPA